MPSEKHPKLIGDLGAPSREGGMVRRRSNGPTAQAVEE